ncbi:MAG: sugar phosphate isomerase/epimerase [Clostridia bacterium]
MKFTGRTSMVPNFTIEEIFKEFKSIGYDGVELAMVDSKFDFLNEMTELFFAKHVVECAEKYDLPIESISYHCGYILEDQKFENLKKAIKATPLYGAKILITSNNMIDWKDYKEEYWDIFIERTKELVKIAEEVDVIFAMEFEPSMICGCTAHVLKMFEAIPSDHLKANCDIGHMFLCDPDPLHCIEQLKGKIAHAHVENMRRGIHRHLPLDKGDMNVKEYIDKLKEVGFDGAIAYDLYGYDYIEESIKAIPIIREMM